jgi:multiple sugar transport system permease protein
MSLIADRPDTRFVQSRSRAAKQLRMFLSAGTLTLFTITALLIYLMPFGYALVASLRIKNPPVNAPLLPMTQVTFRYQDTDLEVFNVPTESGLRSLAMLKKGRETSQFIDPANPGEIIDWTGNWRQLDISYKWDPQWKNFAEVWKYLNFGRLLFNTIVIAALGTLGTVLSCTVVAYGFARFRLPGKGLLFTLLLGTIILPSEVTLIPTYIVFYKIGWVGTWLPLIVPHFFANAWNVFLMRQFLMGISREIDEAAMIDGANPLQTLLFVIIPQAMPAILAISLFHFFWAWNDFFQPLIYLAGKPALYTISVAMQTFQVQYGGRPELTMTASLMATVLPFILFFLGQRFFMQGIVVTGVEK